MKWVSRLFLLGLLSAASSGVSAGTGWFDREPPVAEIQAAHSFGLCLAARSQSLAMAYVGVMPGGTSASKFSGAFREDNCYRPAVLKPHESWVVRGAIFEGWLKQRHPEPWPASYQGVPWVDYAFAEASRKPTSRFYARDSVGGHFNKLLLEYADCVVRRQPIDAANLLKTEVASARERSAADALSSSLSACLTKGAEMKVRIWLFRAHLAEAMLKLNEVKAGWAGLARVKR